MFRGFWCRKKREDETSTKLMTIRELKIGIIGVGMVGGPLARFFQEVGGYVRGRDIFLYDKDPAKGYDDDSNRADVVFVAVPTPRGKDDAVNLKILASAVAVIRESKIVVIKSTVPPGTTEALQKQYPRHRFLFNPEFLTEARAWEDTLHPDRQLVGFTAQSRDVAVSVLALLPSASLSSPSPVFALSATEAEIVKYAANMFLTRKVTFANAIFDLASRHAADYEHIRAGIAADSRIGPSHLDIRHHGYRGYGGYCFIKDTDGLIAHLKSGGLRRAAALFEADRAFNENLLASQGLTWEEVSVHDAEWIKRKLKAESGTDLETGFPSGNPVSKSVHS